MTAHQRRNERIELAPRCMRPAVYLALRRAGFDRRDVLRAMWHGIDDVSVVPPAEEAASPEVAERDRLWNWLHSDDGEFAITAQQIRELPDTPAGAS
jgi:hypothetical protein